MMIVCYNYYNMNDLDLLTIGDVTTDAFIRIKDATVNCNIDKTNCQLGLRFGDKVPYESVTVIRGVGNSANAAVAGTKLNLKTAFVSVVGDDEEGRKTITAFKDKNIITDFIAVDHTQATNYHYVLWYETDRTILVNHHPYNYAWPSVPAARGVYLSSLGEGAKNLYPDIVKYLVKNPETFFTFQPGTFQIKLGTQFLKDLYHRCNLLVVNVEEAKKILNKSEATPTELLYGLHQLGPNYVAVTDGPRGAYASDGQKTYFMPPYPDQKPPLERTGAGDAFASTLTTALIKGRPFEKALSWAPINSMSVVQQIGAQAGLLTEAEILNYISEAPDSYHPRPL